MSVQRADMVEKRKPLDRDVDRVASERDLYLQLLKLAMRREVESLLEEALSIMVDLAEAKQGYIELHRQQDDLEPQWQISHGFSADEIRQISEHVSSGIIAETLASGDVVSTQSAQLDPRFRDRTSVKASSIDAVLCVPIGGDMPRGALYLQGRHDGEPFGLHVHELALLFAHHLGPLVDSILERADAPKITDPTAIYREQLRVDAMIGRSGALAHLFRNIGNVVPLAVSVLLTGESGTGKRLVAKAIHDSGPRAGRPFVEVNCAALPEPMMEFELFGRRPGRQHKNGESVGKVSLAHGGTLFLREVAALARDAQGVLLELLQTGSYRRNDMDSAVEADVRIIASSSIDLEQAVHRGDFREDLGIRLKVLPIRVPTLYERRADIGELALHFVDESIRLQGLPLLELSPGALRAIEAVEWPGNIGQLERVVREGVVRAASGGAKQVEEQHLFPPNESTRSSGGPDRGWETFQQATRRFQAELLAETLAETGWNVSEAARWLDITRAHMYNLIKAFHLSREPK